MFHNANPHVPEFGHGLDYEPPREFDRSTSLGSMPLICCVSLQPQTDADVVPIEKVRLMQARALAEKPVKVDVNLSPWEEGCIAAQGGRGERSCPYELFSPEYLEWLDGFESDIRLV